MFIVLLIGVVDHVRGLHKRMMAPPLRVFEEDLHGAFTRF
jgi:hypothetical protein